MTSHIIRFGDLPTADLHPGATYEAGTQGNYGDEPIHLVLEVGNQGGIRQRGPTEAPLLVALFSTLEHEDWPDQIDAATGVVRYHGDNHTAVSALLDSKGNRVLRHVFSRGFSSVKDRMSCPPVFVFTSADDPGSPKRSQRFEGVAVPGSDVDPPEDWLVAKWFDRPSGRFENYVVTVTLLETATISRAWISELAGGDPLGPSCPESYRHWVETSQRRPRRRI